MNTEMEPQRQTPLWKMFVAVVLHPSVENFERYEEEASGWRAMSWIVGVTVLGGLLATLLAALTTSKEMLQSILWLLPRPNADFLISLVERIGAVPFILLTGLAGTFAMLAAVFAQTLVNAAITHTIARLLRGEGSFEPLFFFLALIHTPLYIIGGVVEMLPLLFPGALATLCLGGSSMLLTGLSLYVLFLDVLAVSAVHRLDLGHSLLAVLGMLAAAFLLSCLFTWVIGGGLMLFIAPAIGH